MPLTKYGVLIGTKSNYYRDDPDEYGRYYHGNVEIIANGIRYRCAIDVDSHASNTGVERRIIKLKPSDLGIVATMVDGWHLLASTSNSGAVDYVRSSFMAYRIRIFYFSFLKVRIPKIFILGKKFIWNRASRFQKFFARWIFLHPSFFWRRGNSLEAIIDLETVLNQGNKLYIFGEFFNTGNGVHDIHQNQGDPLNSQWSSSNGIWQDGATIVQKANGEFVGFFNKFTSQSYFTDNLGHPI